MERKLWLYFGNLKSEAIVIFFEVEDTKIIKYTPISFHHISENLWNHVSEFLTKNDYSIKSIEKLYLNLGPSRFNGDRLMTLGAKTFCFFQKIPLFTISNLKLHLLFFDTLAIYFSANQQEYFLAWIDEQNKYQETVIFKRDFLTESHKYKVNFCEKTWLEFYDHVQTVLNHLNDFESVHNVKEIQPNYLKEVIK